MRSIPLKAATFLVLAGAWACGGDGGGVGPGNNAPVAAFTAPACTVNVACVFTDASTDPEGVADIKTRHWEFNDNSATPTSDDQNPTHTFAAAGTFNVKLTVTDAAGASNFVTHDVIVSAGTTNVPPTAAFSPPSCTVGIACAFTDASTDDAGVTAWSWNFGDNTPADPTQHPTHTFGAPNTYQVTLTVTDAQGATNAITQPVVVSNAAEQDCAPAGKLVTCTLIVGLRSTVTLSLTSTSCEITGNNVFIAAPRRQTVWFNVCPKGTDGLTYTVRDANGAPQVFEAGSQVAIEFAQGTLDPTDPPAGTPAARLDGTSPSWTINIDDGGNRNGAGEPDFGDVVIGVQATPAP
jgi:PKD repeat protein